MRKLKFDKNGLLNADEPIKLTLDELAYNFVETFPNSMRRKWLLENYLEFIDNLQQDVFPYFTQWINGSFVTKKQEPKDIDIVTFVDYRIYKSKSIAMEKFWSFNLEDKGLDNYFVALYPPDHELFDITNESKAKWTKLYSKTRPLNDGLFLKKGFIEIHFEKEIQ
jgi:hypothetical protein